MKTTLKDLEKFFMDAPFNIALYDVKSGNYMSFVEFVAYYRHLDNCVVQSAIINFVDERED